MYPHGSMTAKKLKVAFPASWPFALLAVAWVAVFLLGGDRSHFYRHGHHDWVSSEQLAIATNLSPAHRFLMFYYQRPPENSRYAYELYNRWPVVGYVPIKAAIAPFGESLSAQIYAGRVLMLLFFAGAMVASYLALYRLVSNRWVAVAATLWAFSSYYSLYYGDMISPEVVMSLTGILWAFHGMVVFMQENRFRQLLVKTCVALLTGWQVYALLLPFVVFGLVGEFVRSRADTDAAPARARRATLQQLGADLIRSRFLMLGVVALLFGMLFLTFNFTNEYRALQGEVPLTEIPTVVSLQHRLGLVPEFTAQYTQYLVWGPFLKQQFYRLGALTLPYWWSNRFGDLDQNPAAPAELVGNLIVGVGILVFGVCLAWSLRHRWRIPLTSLVLSGLGWALVFRHQVAFHDYLILHHMGVPLVFCSLVLLYLYKSYGHRVAVGSAVGTLLVFVLSSWQMSGVGHDSEAAAFDAAIIADFENIRKATAPAAHLFLPVPDMPKHLVPFAGARHAVNFYLAGKLIGYETPRKSDAAGYQYVVTSIPLDGDPGLTPENQLRFLYRAEEYAGSFRKQVERIGQANPVARSDFTVYLEADTLIYFKESCSFEDIAAKFLLHLTPADAADLPDHPRGLGFDNREFDFYTYGVRFDGQCLAYVPLPSYDIVEIHTGQYVYEKRQVVYVWQARFRPAG